MFRAALKSNFQSVAAKFGKNMAAESKRFKHGSSENNMVWVDLEMTGLDVNTEHIIEMACLVTDSQLGIIAEGPNLVIHQPEEVLAAMGDWCTQHHGQSGLTQAVRESQISVKQAEDQMLGFIQQYTIPGKCPLAGNSVHMDKRFLDKYMPSFSKHLHYRIIDVSTVKEICRRWYPAVYKQAPKKGLSHRALDDIKESIKEMQFYQSKIFIPSAEKVV